MPSSARISTATSPVGTPARERIFGYTAEEAIRPAGHDAHAPGSDQSRTGDSAAHPRGERIDRYKTVRRCKDGTLLNISLTVSPIIDANGRVVGASKVARNITERKEAEEPYSAFRQYETLLNQAPLGVYLVDADFRIRDVIPSRKRRLAFQS